MSEERVFRNQLREKNDQVFLAFYLATKEKDWAEMSRGFVRALEDELIYRGLTGQVLEATGELMTPGQRVLGERKLLGLSIESPTGTAPSMENPLPSASIPSGDVSAGVGPAPVAGKGSLIAPPSSGENSGAQNAAESGYGMVAYQRLPLAGKRDAFVADGFLYVRNDKLKEWLNHLRPGKCCPPSIASMGYHAKDCWIGNAVR